MAWYQDCSHQWGASVWFMFEPCAEKTVDRWVDSAWWMNSFVTLRARIILKIPCCYFGIPLRSHFLTRHGRTRSVNHPHPMFEAQPSKKKINHQPIPTPKQTQKKLIWSGTWYIWCPKIQNLWIQNDSNLTRHRQPARPGRTGHVQRPCGPKWGIEWTRMGEWGYNWFNMA